MGVTQSATQWKMPNIDLPKTRQALEELNLNGDLTDRDMAVFDEQARHAVLKAAASLLRRGSARQHRAT